MMLQRRDFMARCAAGAAALAAPGGLFAAVGDTTTASMPAAMSGSASGSPKAVFKAALGRRFECSDAAGRTCTLVLSEVSDGQDAPGVEQFRVVFTDTAGMASWLNSDLYVLRNREAGVFLLHLEAGSSHGDRYVAHFGRLT